MTGFPGRLETCPANTVVLWARADHRQAEMHALRCTRMVSKYRRGYMGRDYHVTGGHETEAEAVRRATRPTRLGLLVLRLLGYRGVPPRPHRENPN